MDNTGRPEPTREEGLEAVASLAVSIGEDMIKLLRELYELYADVGLTIPQPLRSKIERAIGHENAG